MLRFIYLGFLSLVALSFTSCAAYNARMLSTPSPLELQKQPMNHGIRVYAHALSKRECRKFLGRNLIAKGYQPVQLFIENHTDQTYLVSKSGICLPLADPEEVAKKMHTSTVARAVGYGACTILVSPFFAIPAIMESVGSAHANDLIDTDYAAKGIKEGEIYPYSFANMILFVPNEAFQQSFSITLLNAKTKEPERLFAMVA